MSFSNKLIDATNGLGSLLNAANASSSMIDEYEQKIIDYFINKYGPNLVQLSIGYDREYTAKDWNYSHTSIVVLTDGIVCGDPMVEDTDAISELMPGEYTTESSSLVWTFDINSNHNNIHEPCSVVKILYRR